jgi:predicted transposase YdaD
VVLTSIFPGARYEDRYRFDSVAVKEPKFEIDGVFLPPETEGKGIVYFCEVQFQKAESAVLGSPQVEQLSKTDELLYERLFGESLLYFYRNRVRFSETARSWGFPP